MAVSAVKVWLAMDISGVQLGEIDARKVARGGASKIQGEGKILTRFFFLSPGLRVE